MAKGQEFQETYYEYPKYGADIHYICGIITDNSFEIPKKKKKKKKKKRKSNIPIAKVKKLQCWENVSWRGYYEIILVFYYSILLYYFLLY